MTPKTFLSMLLFLGVLATIEQDCQALQQVFFDMGSTKVLKPNCCERFVIECSADAVTSIVLYDSTVQRIPESIGRLQSLQNLFVSSSALVGPLPEQLNTMTHLTSLGIVSKSFSSPLTLAMPWLERLQISYSNLTGQMPSVSQFKNLSFLDLSNNQLESLSDLNLPNLRYLYLSNNKIQGVLPDLTPLPNLLRLEVGKNLFSGSVPPSYTNHTNLELLELSGNPNLAGTLPVFPKQLLQCEAFNTKLCNDPKTPKQCDASPCLTDALKSQCQVIQSALDDMQGFQLNDCCFDSSLRCNAESVLEIDWTFRSLSGKVSDKLYQLNLTSLNLYGNQLTEISPQIKNLQQLKSLNFGGNLFRQLPSEISQLQRLETLRGESPYNLSLAVAPNGFKALTECHLSSNICMSGVIPKACYDVKACVP